MKHIGFKRMLTVSERGGVLVACWESTQINSAMYLGKFENEQMTLVECEGGHEVGGVRTEEELRQDGFKNACLVEKPSETAVESWQEYEDCFVQVWEEVEPVDEDEITDAEALQIITGQ